MTDIDSHTRLCAVIGNPIEHSLSPAIHNAAFRAAQLNCVYLAFQVHDVAGFLTGMRAMPSFRGLSVTIPHKLAVMACLDEIDPGAVHVGAVNTIVNEEGRLKGFTTDGPGTLRAFERAGVTLGDKSVAFVGAGGAVRSVAFAFAGSRQCARISILGRNRERVQALVNDLRDRTGADVQSGDLVQDLEATVASHDIIVNGTPLGMFPNNLDATPVPCSLLNPNHVVFDMVYRPLKTRLIRDAEDAGCRTVLGIEMLIQQAALQFELWMNIPAPADVMRDAVLYRFSETVGVRD